MHTRSRQGKADRREQRLTLEGRVVAGLLLGTLFVAGCYARLAGCGFLNYDDPDYVTANSNLLDGVSLATLRWAFTAGHSCNWHPLTWLSHLLDLQLFGLDPTGHHLASLAFHCANTVLLATTLMKMTGARWRPLLVALLFALHPLHVESVAWVSERKDVLSAFFWLLAMHGYASYVRRPAAGRYVLTLGLFILGLLSKPMVVTFPLVLLLLDCWPLRRPGVTPVRRLVVEKLPFFLLSAASAVITYMVQSSGGAVPNGDSLWINAGNAILSYARYLEKTFLPTGLAYFYPFNPEEITAGRVALAATLLAVISLLVIRCRHRAPYLMAGWLWYLVTLLPVIGFIRIGDQALADRYTYLPLIGIFIMLVWGGWDLVCGKKGWERTAMAGISVLIFVFALLTWRQTGYWKNDLTLNRHALEVTTGNWTAHHNLATELNLRGDIEGAVAEYRASLAINPGFERGHYSLGKLFLSIDRPEEAAASFRKAVECKPDFAAARFNLGYACLLLARPEEAKEQYRSLVRIDPAQAAALLDVITRYEHLGRSS